MQQHLSLFVACSRIAITSFGSPPFWARRELVERQRWLSEEEFLELLALGQLLPGPNVVNVLAILGYRLAGWGGAAAAVAGVLVWPFLIVIGLGMLHQQYGALPLVHAAVSGMSMVAAGLVLATAMKMAEVLPYHWRPWLYVVLSFVAVGVLRWPLLVVLGVLVPFALVTAWRQKE
jgi:chromate transporter